MAVKLTYNPEQSAFEVTVGENTWAQEIHEDDESIMLHHDGGCFVVTLDDADLEGLEPNTVYELVKVPTIIGAPKEIEVVDEEDDEEGDEPAGDLN